MAPHLSGRGRGFHRDLREGLRLRGIPALGLRTKATPRGTRGSPL